MRQEHRAGEKLFIDFCGPTVPVINPDTGEIYRVAIFVAVMGRPTIPTLKRAKVRT